MTSGTAGRWCWWPASPGSWPRRAPCGLPRRRGGGLVPHRRRRARCPARRPALRSAGLADGARLGRPRRRRAGHRRAPRHHARLRMGDLAGGVPPRRLDIRTRPGRRPDRGRRAGLDGAGGRAGLHERVRRDGGRSPARWRRPPRPRPTWSRVVLWSVALCGAVRSHRDRGRLGPGGRLGGLAPRVAGGDRRGLPLRADHLGLGVPGVPRRRAGARLRHRPQPGLPARHRRRRDGAAHARVPRCWCPTRWCSPAPTCSGPGSRSACSTIVSPAEVTVGALPVFPMLAALPDSGPTPGWTAWLVAGAPGGRGGRGRPRPAPPPHAALRGGCPARLRRRDARRGGLRHPGRAGGRAGRSGPDERRRTARRVASWSTRSPRSGSAGCWAGSR